MHSVLRGGALIAMLAVCSCADDNEVPVLVDASAPVTDAGTVPTATTQADASVGSSSQALKTGCDAIEMASTSDGFQLEMPLPVPAAQEREYCMLVLIDRDINLNWADGRYTKGSHHGNLYRTSYKDAIPTETVTGETFENADKPHPCLTPTAMWDVEGVVATGRGVDVAKPNGEGGYKVLPEDVAFKIKKGDVLLVNFHMINTTEKTLDSCFKLGLHGIPDAQVKHEAGTLFTYNTNITVPPMGQSTARMACPVRGDVTLVTSQSHMHARGDGYWANLLDKAPSDPTAKVVTELYRGTEWDDPPIKVFPQPLSLKSGQWIDYECHYTNREPRSVSQGYASTDEMCMFLGIYWPKDRAFETCRHPEDKDADGATASIFYGHGTKSGAEFLQCLGALPEQKYTGAFDDPARFATQSCYTQTCAKASPGLQPYLTCLGRNVESCTEQCTDAQASFQAACALGECKEEFGTDGSNGTCATSVGAEAVKACTKPAQIAAFTKTCATGLCAAACATPTDPACAACIGTFDGVPTNTACMNVMVGACAQDQGKKLATACVETCFTGCITKSATSCTTGCLNEQACKTEVTTVATATCN